MAPKRKNRMRRAKRLQQRRVSNLDFLQAGGIRWMEQDGMHALVPGEKPSEAMQKKMTKSYQRQLRKSALFKQWVAESGKKEALKMLKECRVEVK